MPPTIEPIDNSTHGDSLDVDPVSSNQRSRTPLIAAVVAAAVVAATVGGFVAAGATTDASKSELDSRALDLDSPLDLQDTTLGELADDLAELGLHVEIGPDRTVVDEFEVMEEGTVPQADDDQNGAFGGQDEIDPFEGLTETEIDALSDDEYFDRLDAAGIDIDEYFEDEGFEDEGFEDVGFEDHGFDDEEPIASAAISGNSIDLSGLDSDAATQVQEIWGRFTELIPADQRQMISSFEIAADDDGAYVYQDESDPAKWVLGVSRGLGDDLDSVLLHEFGHLLTLQAKEVPPTATDNECSTYFTGEGCALSGSTIAEFVQKFWPQSQLDEIDSLEQAGDYDGLDAFYAARATDFVTDYAATNPGEDLAETFAIFVLDPRPTGSTIADQKVQMLWSDADLVALRDQIRGNL